MPRPTLPCPTHMHASAPLLPQCNRAMSPNFVFSWPHARMGIGDIGHTAFDREEAPEMTGEECSWRLLDDGLILPHQTKEVCLLQLAWLYVHCPSYPSPAPPAPPLSGAHLLPGGLLTTTRVRTTITSNEILKSPLTTTYNKVTESVSHVQ